MSKRKRYLCIIEEGNYSGHSRSFEIQEFTPEEREQYLSEDEDNVVSSMIEMDKLLGFLKRKKVI